MHLGGTARPIERTRVGAETLVQVRCVDISSMVSLILNRSPWDREDMAGYTVGVSFSHVSMVWVAIS